MKVSIVIPTLNRPVELKATIDDLLNQSYQDFEILIIDQSDPLISEQNRKLSSHPKIVYLYQVERSASIARNRGLTEARGEITLFLDDDVQITTADFLNAHVLSYANKKLPGVAGAILNPGQSFRTHRHWLSSNLQYGWLFFPINYAQKRSIRNGWAGNLSVRTAFAKSIGGMDERYSKGAFREESDFCTRLCNSYGPMLYNPDAWLIHLGAGTGGLRTFRQQNGIRAQHHFDGFFYYTIRLVPFFALWAHLVSFFRIFFPVAKLRSPRFCTEFIKRCFRGYKNARQMKKEGPLYLSGYENYRLR